MAYVKEHAPSEVYHLAKQENLNSILDDGMIRRFSDTECWFCADLQKMRAYMEQTVMCEGKPYYNVTGQLCRYPKFVPEDYVLLKLIQQKEFHTIKNMIIQQAETFRQPVSEQIPVETEPNEQQVPPSPESAVAMPQPQAVTSQIKIEGGAVIQLLHHMSRVFRGNMPVIPPALRIDSKRRRRLQEKRMAMGHKRDDHEDEQLYHVNDNTMQ